jgi:geranylgeranyl diphosphate synthase type II
MGAIIAGANESDANHLYDFGVNLGVAFQLQDDILDVFGDADKFGKQVGGDILSNKKTYLLLTALNSAQGATKESLLQWINTSDKPQEKVVAVTNIYNSLNVREVAEEKMNEMYRIALSHLESIPVLDDNKQPLKDLAASLMVRQN